MDYNKAKDAYKLVKLLEKHWAQKLIDYLQDGPKDSMQIMVELYDRFFDWQKETLGMYCYRSKKYNYMTSHLQQLLNAGLVLRQTKDERK